MGWSITEYDSLRLLYVEPNGYPHVFRKSLTRFEHRVPSESFIVMTVHDDFYAKNSLPFNGPISGGGSPYTSYNVGFSGTVLPYTQTLYLAEADNPIVSSVQDLLDQLNALLLSADVKVEKNGVFVGEQPSINFIEGPNITITALDDLINKRVDVTIESTGGGGPTDDPFPKILMLMGG